MRSSTVSRTTAETVVTLTLALDGSGSGKSNTGVDFLDHMLTLFAHHGNFDLTVEAKGDIWVDFHHTVEDVGICLGKAFAEALGDKTGIRRYGSITLPMDEALILCAADCSGRGMFCGGLDLPTPKVGNFDTELAEEFFIAFARSSGVTLHIRQLAGRNSHHIIEGAFKALGRALREAAEQDSAVLGRLPSTKGVL